MTDKQLKGLFDQLDRTERQAAMLRARIAAARGDYAKRNGLLALPRVETMRKAIGA